MFNIKCIHLWSMVWWFVDSIILSCTTTWCTSFFVNINFSIIKFAWILIANYIELLLKKKTKNFIIPYIQENHCQSYKFLRVVTISIQSRWYQFRQFDEKIKFSCVFLRDRIRNHQAGQKRKFSKLKYNSKTTKTNLMVI